MAAYYISGDPGYQYMATGGHSDVGGASGDPYMYGYLPEGNEYFYAAHEIERPKAHSINCNGYEIQVTSGQRKYGGPPPNWTDPNPGEECEVYVGRLPRNMLEDTLLPLFEKFGRIFELRLMMVDFTPRNRGFAFVRFTTQESATAAIAQLNDKPIGSFTNQRLRVEACAKKVRLYIANIPKAKTQEELQEEFSKRTTGLKEVIIYKPTDEQDKDNVRKNRGFCFLEYDSHSNAFTAKKYLSKNVRKLWGCELVIDWADPLKEPDEEVMAKVKVLYVRKLTARATEERLHALFSTYGIVERVKRLKDFAFVHFENRADAEKALKEQQGEEFCGSKLDIEWGKPPEDKRQLEEMLRARERRMTEGNYLYAPHTPYAAYPIAVGWNYAEEGYDPGYYEPPSAYDYMNGGSAAASAASYYPRSMESTFSGSPGHYPESTPPSSPEVYRRAPPADLPPAMKSPSGSRLRVIPSHAFDSPAPLSPDQIRHHRDRRNGYRRSEYEHEHGHDRYRRTSRPYKAEDRDGTARRSDREGNWRRKSGSSRTRRDYSHGEPQTPSPPGTPPYNGSNPNSPIHWRSRH